MSGINLILKVLNNKSSESTVSWHVWSCQQCDLKYTAKCQLKNHIMSAHEGIRYQCDECERKFTMKSSIRKHKRNMHNKQHLCEQCNFEAVYKADLKKHIKLMHPVLNDKYCDKCNSKFASLDTLRTHKLVVHEEFSYSCKSCDFKASHLKKLTLHMSSVHKGKIYPCDQCNSIIASPEALWNHKMIVHKEYLYPCKICDFKASRIGKFKLHMRSLHKGESFSFNIK